MSEPLIVSGLALDVIGVILAVSPDIGPAAKYTASVGHGVTRRRWGVAPIVTGFVLQIIGAVLQGSRWRGHHAALSGTTKAGTAWL